MESTKKNILRVDDIYQELEGVIPKSTLYKVIVTDKKMIYFRVGRAICVTRESFDAFVANGSAK
jgi:hypothetical protein